MPLASSFWLGQKKGKEAWVQPVIEGKGVRFEVAHGPASPPPAPKTGRGAKFSCLVCGEAASESHIKAEGKAGRMGVQLMAVVAEGTRQRVYLAPSEDQVQSAQVQSVDGVPDQELVDDPRAIWCKLYGLDRHADLFTSRQLAMLTTLSDLVGEVRTRVIADAQASGLDAGSSVAYADAVSTYLGFALDRILNESCALCTWVPSPTKEHVKNAFGRQAIPMAWDFAESNPFGESTGSFLQSVGRVAEVLARTPASGGAEVEQADARRVSAESSIVATDPPYYDNIGYADLADFFYVWARRTMSAWYPGLFATLLTPKAEELIASPYRHGGSKDRAEAYFEQGFIDVFQRLSQSADMPFPMTFFYAFKQSEDDALDGLGSTGWSTMLEGLLAANWMVTATWPMRTERSTGLKSKDNALASSVVLACRARPVTAGVTDRQGFIRALQQELPDPLHELQKAHIAPVDLRQAAIGPGMAVFSRFAKVVEPDGSTMRVRTALGLINQVLDQVLGEQESEFDAETRWAIHWFSQYFADEGPYGIAEQLAVSMNVAVSKLVSSGVVAAGGGKVRLLGRDELAHDWDPTRDLRTPVWEATQHLVKRLEEDGEGATARLLRKLGGLGESAALLATDCTRCARRGGRHWRGRTTRWSHRGPRSSGCRVRRRNPSRSRNSRPSTRSRGVSSRWQR